MSLEELKKALKEKSLVMGLDKITKKLKMGKLKKVFVAKNCPIGIVKDLEYYSKINKVELVKLDKSNEEIGMICKKPFSILVLGY